MLDRRVDARVAVMAHVDRRQVVPPPAQPARPLLGATHPTVEEVTADAVATDESTTNTRLVGDLQRGGRYSFRIGAGTGEATEGVFQDDTFVLDGGGVINIGDVIAGSVEQVTAPPEESQVTKRARGERV